MARGLPSMTALLGLLAVAGYQNRDKLAEMFGGGQSGAQRIPPGGVAGGTGVTPGGMGTAGGAGGLGGLLGGLSGQNPGSVLSGGLGGIVDRFRQNGYGEAADSWVARGPNRELPPQDLERAIGSD